MQNNQTSTQTVIGIDLGDREHFLCVLDKDAKAAAEFTIPNHKRHLEQLARDYPGARVAMEAGTHSPWISRLLERLGMEVLVANPRKLRAIYKHERKCDRRDARMLARIARLDSELLSPVRHCSEESQQDLLLLKFRDALVRQRVALVNAVRSSLKALGVRLSLSGPSSFVRAARATLAEHPALLAMSEPLLAMIDEINSRIRHYDKEIEQCAAQKHPQTSQLQAICGVGPITSLCYVLTIEDPARFQNSRDVAAWLGLVPRRDQSGESDKQLPISKTGNCYLRSLLVQCAQYMLGNFGPDCELRRHGLKLAERGGKAAKKKAVIAVARKLAVLMLSLWKSGQQYQPVRPAAAPPALAA